MPFDPWGPLQALLEEVGEGDSVRAILAEAGLPPTRPLTANEAYSHRTRVRAYLEMATASYPGLDDAARRVLVTNVARALVGRIPRFEARLDEILRRIGWRYLNGSLILVGIVDEQDLAQVPARARADLLKAAERITTDPSGAITAASGAIDALTEDIYRQHSLGNAGEASFQERVNQSLKAIGAFQRYTDELVGLGWDTQRAEKLVHNLRGSISQAAFVIQTLRANMGDAHGSKPTIERLVFQSVRWMVIIATNLR